MHTLTETASCWSSESPLGFAAGDTNLQRYVGNSPTNYTDPTGLWREGGHFYTTYNIGRLAGMNHNDARELAYYSQYPDEVNAYDAVYVAHPDWPWSSRKSAEEIDTHESRINAQAWEERIQRVLHQLHGGDIFEITRNREHLKSLFKDAIKERDFKFAGVLLHALGDSYAHTYRDKNGNCRAFDSGVGHLVGAGPLTGKLHGGKAVDKIRERYVDGVYPSYVNSLADLLGISEDDPRVHRFLDRMEPTMDDGGTVRTKNGGIYTDEREDSLLKTFPVSGKMINGLRDSYISNEMQQRSNQRYFPENGLHGGLGRIPFHDMVSFLEQMRQ